MSDFGALTDHWGYASATLKLVDSSKTPVAESEAQALDENGDLAAQTFFGNDGGDIADASCTYALISGTLNLNTLSLGELSTGQVVESIEAATSNGAWPQITVTGKLGTAAFQAPTGKTAKAALPSLTLTGGKFAQVMSFTVGDGCKLTGCSFSVAGEITQQDDGLGEPVAYAMSFNNAPEVTAEFVAVTDAPSWTPTGSLTEVQAPSLAEPQAAYHTSTAMGKLGLLVRGT